VDEFAYAAAAAECKTEALRLMTSGGGYRFADPAAHQAAWAFDIDTYDPAACKVEGPVVLDDCLDAQEADRTGSVQLWGIPACRRRPCSPPSGRW